MPAKPTVATRVATRRRTRGVGKEPMMTTESKDGSPPVEPLRMSVLLQNPLSAHGPGGPADLAGPIGLLVDLADVLRGELGGEGGAGGQPAGAVAARRRLLGGLEPVAPAAAPATAGPA